MKLQRCVLCAFAALLLVPSAAHAHLVNSGLGPFYDGGMHLAVSPDDLLGLLAVALLAGLRGAQAGRYTAFVLPAAWLVGGMAGLTWSSIPAMPGLSVLSFAVLGVLVAVDVKLPAWSVSVLACVLGLLHGVLNGAVLSQAGMGVLPLLGIVSTVFILALVVSGVVVSLRPAWCRIVVRVAGSWVTAVGMLMFGWLFQGGG